MKYMLQIKTKKFSNWNNYFYGDNKHHLQFVMDVLKGNPQVIGVRLLEVTEEYNRKSDTNTYSVAS